MCELNNLHYERFSSKPFKSYVTLEDIKKFLACFAKYDKKSVAVSGYPTGTTFSMYITVDAVVGNKPISKDCYRI